MPLAARRSSEARSASPGDSVTSTGMPARLPQPDSRSATGLNRVQEGGYNAPASGFAHDSRLHKDFRGSIFQRRMPCPHLLPRLAGNCPGPGGRAHRRLLLWNAGHSLSIKNGGRVRAVGLFGRWRALLAQPLPRRVLPAGRNVSDASTRHLREQHLRGSLPGIFTLRIHRMPSRRRVLHPGRMREFQGRGVS
jgi:hypothetical protein